MVRPSAPVCPVTRRAWRASTTARCSPGRRDDARLPGAGRLYRHLEVGDQAKWSVAHTPSTGVATDKYVGEGYDCPRLDTLFLAHPVSFKGNMVQYVGRILRNHPGKTTVEVHDYVDSAVGVLAAMWRKRSHSYAQLGFTTATP
jgi:hypothetical protein